MQNGRDHDEREQKFGTRIDRELSRGSGDDESVGELDRRAKSTDPAPTKKADDASVVAANADNVKGGFNPQPDPPARSGKGKL